MITVFLLCLFVGFTCCTEFVKKPNFPTFVNAWDGACALLKCEYFLIRGVKQLSNLTWYKDPVYNDKEMKWEGTIVYSHWRDEQTSTESFGNRVRFLGDLKNDCTLLIQDVRVNDSGQYGVRLEEGITYKWMSKPFLFLNVTDYPPKPHIVVATSGITDSQRTSITCSIDYHCPEYPMQLRWEGPVQGEHGTQFQESTSALKTTNTLNFLPSWQHDQKVLRCLLSSEKDTRARSESEITLDVKHSPKLVEVSLGGQAPTIKEGESLTLQCLVNSSNPPVSDYKWFKEGDTRYKAEGQLFNIKHASAKDSGKYLCEAANSFNKTNSSSVKIDVQFGPKEATVKISVTGLIKEKDYVTVTCTAQSNPPVTTFHWYKDDRYLCQTTGLLEFKQISDNDSGEYECRVYHPMGNASSHGQRLNVLYAPRGVGVAIQAPDKAWIKEGDAVQLDCTYNSSNPEVSAVTWYRNKQNISATEGKVFQSITAEESGHYACELQNKARLSRISQEVLIDVKYAPKDVHIDPRPSLNLKEGDAAELTCTVRQSNPAATEYTWYKANETYHGSRGSKIHFPSLKSSDSGSYICEAANNVSATKSNALLLVVQYGPRNVVISLDPSASLIEDSNVTLFCDADALPKAHLYIWYKMNHHFKNTYSNRLLLGNIKKNEAGLYYCEAKNDIASKKSGPITLDVYYSSRSIARFAAVAIGVVLFLVLMVVLALRFEVWQKLMQRRVSTSAEADDRSDTFFVLNKKRTRDNQYDGLRNGATSSDPEYEESLNYSMIQFSPGHIGEDSEITRACINNRSSMTLKREDTSPIYSVVKKPHKPPQVREASIDYENTADKTNDDIKYATIVNLICKPKETEPESGSESEVFSVDYAELKL